MKNLATMIIFFLVFNLFGGMILGYFDSSSLLYDEKVNERYITQLDAQIENLQGTEFEESSQSQYTTDIIPMVDINGGSFTILKYLGNGLGTIWLTWDAPYENPVEKAIWWMMKLSMLLMNIVGLTWIAIFVWGKQVHM